MGLEDGKRGETIPNIQLAHFTEKVEHPLGGEMVDCLTVYIPNSPSMNLLRTYGPTHYTPKVVKFKSLDTSKSASVGASAMSIDNKSREITSKSDPLILDGCFSIRLTDANPPLDASGHPIAGKVVFYLVENTKTNKLVFTVNTAEWIDRTINDISQKGKTRAVRCKGSVLKIYGRVSEVIDPLTIPPYPNFDKHRKRAENIYKRWEELRIKKAKKGN